MLLQSKLIALMMGLSLKNQTLVMDRILMTNQMVSHYPNLLSKSSYKGAGVVKGLNLAYKYSH